jgi:hypothetical protein
MALLHMLAVYAGQFDWRCWLSWLDIMADFACHAVWL